MVFLKYKLNEDKQWNKRGMKKLNEEANLRIQLDITKFFERSESELLLLDRSSPPKRHIKNTFDIMVMK